LRRRLVDHVPLAISSTAPAKRADVSTVQPAPVTLADGISIATAPPESEITTPAVINVGELENGDDHVTATESSAPVNVATAV
jgi:hypothetical protein